MLTQLTMIAGMLAAAILAGGRARRLGGASKGALFVGGRRIIDRQIDVLRQVASPVFVVGRDPGGGLPADIEVVPDRVRGAGALGGIYSAILASPHDRTLVVGCDMPFLRLPVLERLASIADADLVIPRSAGGLEPLCAIYGRACAPEMAERIARGQLHAAVLPRGMRVVEVGPEELRVLDPDGLMFVNVNTPHDYARACEVLEVQTEPEEDRITE